MKLYEIADQIQAVFQELEDACSEDGSVPNSLAEKLSGLEKEYDEKLASCCAFRAEKQGNADLLDAEIKRLQARKRAEERAVHFIDEYMKYHMQQLGEDRRSVDGKWTIRLQNSPPSVAIDDEDAVPDEYKESRTTTSFKRSAIAAALIADTPVAGCRLVRNKHLRIY